MFSKSSTKNLIKAALFKNTPVYVQFYITARCNLTCNQCNIIYSNSDVRECNIDEIKKMADNFVELGVVMVLLTGGEPFARKDLPEIIYAFESRGIHVRMQTNGFASDEQIISAIESGGRDISISLDTLNRTKQDYINGGFIKSWDQALRAISTYTKYLPIKNSFASLGCVLQPNNIGDIEDVIKFGTQISWFTSLVPIHTTKHSKPRGFRTFDTSLDFEKKQFENVDFLIERVRKMKKEGYLLYDSDQYLDDIKRFIRKEPITWRKKNSGICDSPNLYFAVLPNGQFAPCCDFRIKEDIFTFSENFVQVYKSKVFKKDVQEITSSCEGCMYGSYPEMTISMRYLDAKFERFKTFISSPIDKNWPHSYDDLTSVAEKIVNEERNRLENR